MKAIVLSEATGKRYEVEDNAYRTIRYKEYDPYFEDFEYHYENVWNVIAAEAKSEADIFDMVRACAEERKNNEDNVVYDFEWISSRATRCEFAGSIGNM